MEFSDPGHFIGPLFIYVVGGFISAMIALGLTGHYGHQRRSRAEKITAWCIGIGLFTVGAAILNAFAWGASEESQEDRTASVREQLAYFGFTPGVQYDLLLGPTISGTVGEGSVSGSFLGFSGSATARPGSALTVDFQNENKTYVIEPLVENITFDRTIDAKPTIEIYLRGIDETFAVSDASKVGGDLVDYRYGECEPRFKDLILQCIKPTLEVVTTITEDTVRRGPGSLIAEHYHSAIVTLTPEMFEALRGRS